MTFRRYAFERTLAALAGFGIALITVFLIFRVLGPSALPDNVRETPPVREGLERFMLPVHERFARFLTDLATDDFVSFSTGASVRGTAVGSVLVTLGLVAGAIALALAAARLGTLLTARRPGSAVDRISSSLVRLAFGVTPIFSGLLLAYYVGFRLHWTPISGYCPLRDPPGTVECQGRLQWLTHLVLPATTLALPLWAVYARALRAMSLGERRMLAEAGRDEVAALRARLARGRRIALARLVGRDVGWTIGAALLVEAIFGLPGAGQTLLESTVTWDLPVGEGVLVYATLLAIGVHLAVDLATAALAPAVRGAR